MLITMIQSPDQDTKRAVEAAEQSRRGEWPEYTRLKMENVDYFDSATDWEFAYGPAGNYRNRVLIRNFVTTEDRATRSTGVRRTTPGTRTASTSTS